MIVDLSNIGEKPACSKIAFGELKECGSLIKTEERLCMLKSTFKNDYLKSHDIHPQKIDLLILLTHQDGSPIRTVSKAVETAVSGSKPPPQPAVNQIN